MNASNVRSDGPSTNTNPVREPAVKKRLIGWTAFGESQVPLTLQRLEGTKQHRFAAGVPADPEEAIESAKRFSADAAVWNQVGIVRAIAVERGQRPLKERRGDGWAHVHPSIEQLAGETGGAFRDLIEAGPIPVEPSIDGGGFRTGKMAHFALVAIGASDRLSDPVAGRSANIGTMDDKAALALDQLVDQRSDAELFDRHFHPSAIPAERSTNLSGYV